MSDISKDSSSLDGGDNVFPLDSKFKISLLGVTKRLGSAFYTAHQIGETITIYATGIAPNLQTVVKLEILPLMIYPPRFALFFYDPEIVSPAQKPFKVEATLHSDKIIPQVTVLDINGLNVINVENF